MIPVLGITLLLGLSFASEVGSVTAAETLVFDRVVGDRRGLCTDAVQSWIPSTAALRPSSKPVTTPHLRVTAEKFGLALRVQVSKEPAGKIMGLKTFRTKKGCVFSARINDLAKRWLVKVLAVGRSTQPEVAPPRKVETSSPPKITFNLPTEPPPKETPPSIAPQPVSGAAPKVVKKARPLPRPLAPTITLAPKSQTSALEFFSGLSVGSLNLRYLAPTSAALRNYELPVMPLLEVGSSYRRLWGQRLKFGPFVRASYRRSLGVTSRRVDEVIEFPTSYEEYRVGLGAQISVLELRAKYERSSFVLEESQGGELEAELSNLKTHTFSPGVQIKIPVLSSVELFISSDVHIFTDIAASNYSDQQIVSVRGFEMTGGALISISESLGLLFRAEYERRRIEFATTVTADGLQQQVAGMGLLIRILL